MKKLFYLLPMVALCANALAMEPNPARTSKFAPAIEEQERFLKHYNTLRDNPQLNAEEIKEMELKLRRQSLAAEESKEGVSKAA